MAICSGSAEPLTFLLFLLCQNVASVYVELIVSPVKWLKRGRDRPQGAERSVSGPSSPVLMTPWCLNGRSLPLLPSHQRWSDGVLFHLSAAVAFWKWWPDFDLPCCKHRPSGELLKSEYIPSPYFKWNNPSPRLFTPICLVTLKFSPHEVAAARPERRARWRDLSTHTNIHSSSCLWRSEPHCRPAQELLRELSEVLAADSKAKPIGLHPHASDGTPLTV